MPDTALIPMTPRRQKLCFFMMRTSCSMSRGSRPITGARYPRSRLPRRASSTQASPRPTRRVRLVRLDPHEDPVAHLGVDDARRDRHDFQSIASRAAMLIETQLDRIYLIYRIIKINKAHQR